MHPFNPNGVFDLGTGAKMPEARDEGPPPFAAVTADERDTIFPSAPPNIPCWRRRAAWINAAGGFDMTWCADARGRLIHRDAEPGSHDAWDADHVVSRDQGGHDIPTNLRALRSSSDRADGSRR
jgi:hypothetical protein